MWFRHFLSHETRTRDIQWNWKLNKRIKAYFCSTQSTWEDWNYRNITEKESVIWYLRGWQSFINTVHPSLQTEVQGGVRSGYLWCSIYYFASNTLWGLLYWLLVKGSVGSMAPFSPSPFLSTLVGLIPKMVPDLQSFSAHGPDPIKHVLNFKHVTSPIGELCALLEWGL